MYLDCPAGVLLTNPLTKIQYTVLHHLSTSTVIPSTSHLITVAVTVVAIHIAITASIAILTAIESMNRPNIRTNIRVGNMRDQVRAASNTAAAVVRARDTRAPRRAKGEKVHGIGSIDVHDAMRAKRSKRLTLASNVVGIGLCPNCRTRSLSPRPIDVSP